MLKNNKGVTLMSLIVTIVAMVILISVVGYFSLDSVKNSYIANEKKEMADVLDYVSIKRARLLVQEFNVEEKFENIQNKVVTSEALYLIASGLTENDFNRIIEVNTASGLENNHKYLYITSEDLNNDSVRKDEIVIKDAKNNYIINFYTGTIIGLYDNGERIEISGSVKGLSEILDMLY